MLWIFLKVELVEAASMVINAQQAQHHTELVNIEQGLQKLVSKIQVTIVVIILIAMYYFTEILLIYFIFKKYYYSSH